MAPWGVDVARMSLRSDLRSELTHNWYCPICPAVDKSHICYSCQTFSSVPHLGSGYMYLEIRAAIQVEEGKGDLCIQIVIGPDIRRTK